MPATYAHYTFGKAVYRTLPDEIKQLIRENKEAYLIGLHGPDLIFYYRPLGKNRINQTGVRMHRELASDFFAKSRQVYRRRPSYVLLSYLCGFICHFVLDSECHPYIGRYMKSHGVSHGDIETDFDRSLMEKDGRNPTRYNCTRHLIRDLDTEEAIASVLDGVTPAQVDASIVGFRFSIRMLQCPGRGKERFLRAVFRAIGQTNTLSGMIMNGRPHPFCQESRVYLTERMENAVGLASGLIQEYVRNIDTDKALNPRFMRDFE